MPSGGTKGPKGHKSASTLLGCCLVFQVVNGGGFPSSLEHCWLAENVFFLLLPFLPYTKTRQFCTKKPISFGTTLSLRGAKAGHGMGVWWWESVRSSP